MIKLIMMITVCIIMSLYILNLLKTSMDTINDITSKIVKSKKKDGKELNNDELLYCLIATSIHNVGSAICLTLLLLTIVLTFK